MSSVYVLGPKKGKQTRGTVIKCIFYVIILQKIQPGPLIIC